MFNTQCQQLLSLLLANPAYKKKLIVSRTYEFLIYDFLKQSLGLNLWNTLNQISFNNQFNTDSHFSSEVHADVLSYLVSSTTNLVQAKYFFDCHDNYIDVNDPSSICPECGQPANSHPSFHKQLKIYDEVSDMISQFNTNFLDIILDGKALATLDGLQEHRSKVIPFVGAGVSLPFGIPSWAGLLYHFKNKLPHPNNKHYQEIKDSYKQSYLSGDVFQMLEILSANSSAFNNTNQFKNEVADYIRDLQNGQRWDSLPKNENINDILSLNSGLVITTNYDTLLEDYANNTENRTYESISLSDFRGLPTLSKHNVVLHIHGSIHSPSDIVLSKKDYTNLYRKSSDKGKGLLLLLGSYYFLFIGFSLKDKYVVKEFESISKINNGFLSEYLLTLKSEKPTKFSSNVADNIINITINDDVFNDPSLKTVSLSAWNIGIHLVRMYLNDEIYLKSNDEFEL